MEELTRLKSLAEKNKTQKPLIRLRDRLPPQTILCVYLYFKGFPQVREVIMCIANMGTEILVQFKKIESKRDWHRREIKIKKAAPQLWGRRG